MRENPQAIILLRSNKKRLKVFEFVRDKEEIWIKLRKLKQ